MSLNVKIFGIVFYKGKMTMCCKVGKFIFAGVAVLFVAVSVGYVLTDKATANKDSFSANRTIVATVGGEPVYLSEVYNFWQGDERLKNAPIEFIYKDILDTIVQNKALSIQAKRSGVERLASYKADLKRRKEQALIVAYIKDRLDKEITNDVLQAEYEKFVAENPTEDEVQASHILVDSQDLAKKITSEIKKGSSFEDLAAKYSIDSNGKNGGKLGYFKKGDMVPEFASAVFSMKVGDVTKEPIKTMFGWHVVKVTDRRKSAPPEFDKVKDYLKMKLSEDMYPKIIEESKSRSKIIILPAAYKNAMINLSADKKVVEENEKDSEEEILVEDTEDVEDTDSDEQVLIEEEVEAEAEADAEKK